MIDTATAPPTRPQLPAEKDPGAYLLVVLSHAALAWQVLNVFDDHTYPPVFDENKVITEAGIFMKSNAADVVERAAAEVVTYHKANPAPDSIVELVQKARRLLLFIGKALAKEYADSAGDEERFSLFTDAALTLEVLVGEIEAAHRSLGEESPTPNPNEGGTP